MLSQALWCRVEDGRGCLGYLASPRLPSPLIKLDVRVSRIQLSDRFHREARDVALVARGACAASSTSSPRDTARSDRSGYLGVCRPKANHPSISLVTSAPEVRALSSARRYPASSVIRPCPTPADIAIQDSVEAATLMPNGSPPITRITFPACRAHYPGGSNGCVC